MLLIFYTCSILSAIYNGSFLSGEEVTIFEGHRRRDSDSYTHPWPIYSTFRGKNLLGFHFAFGGWRIFGVFTFHDHIDLQIRQKNLDDSLKASINQRPWFKQGSLILAWRVGRLLAVLITVFTFHTWLEDRDIILRAWVFFREFQEHLACYSEKRKHQGFNSGSHDNWSILFVKKSFLKSNLFTHRQNSNRPFVT